MFGARENDDAAEVGIFKQTGEEFALALLFDEHHVLVDAINRDDFGAHFDAHRLVENFGGERLNGSGHGRREQ